MNLQYFGKADQDTSLMDVERFMRLLDKAGDLQRACALFDGVLKQNDMGLISVFFVDMKGEKPAIRPYTNAHEALRNTGVKLREFGGCPILRESKARKHAFAVSSIDHSKYNGFLGRRFFQEFGKLPFNDAAVIPVILGDGLGVFVIGLGKQRFSSEVKSDLISLVSIYATGLICRFPEVLNLFKTKCLTSVEAKVLLFCSNGKNLSEISELLRLSELSVRMIIANAAEKLGTKTTEQTVARAIAMGEFSNMQMGDCDFL